MLDIKETDQLAWWLHTWTTLQLNLTQKNNMPLSQEDKANFKNTPEIGSLTVRSAVDGKKKFSKALQISGAKMLG